MIDLERLFRDLSHGAIAWEVFVLLGCLAVAWGLSWLIGRHQPKESIWFGRAHVDGVLFPLLALALVYTAFVMLGHLQKVPLLRIAVPVLIALAGIRFLARVSTAAFPKSGVARLMERLFSWLAWIAAVLWILGLLPAVMAEMDAITIAFGKSKVSLLTLVEGGLTSGVVLVAALWVSAALERKVLQDAVADRSLRKVAAGAIRAGLLFVGFVFALSVVGVDLTALSVLGGALGVGLGFGMQKLAANYVSGFVVLFERSVRIGDTVRVDNFEGVVADIKTRYTLIRSLSGRESIVPNEKLITERIENLTLDDPNLLVSTELVLGNDVDLEAVQRILLEAPVGVPRVLAKPEPAVRLTRFTADGIEFSVQFWIADPQNGTGNVKSDVNLRVLRALRGAGIEFPTTQRIVRLGPPLTSSATAATG